MHKDILRNFILISSYNKSFINHNVVNVYIAAMNVCKQLLSRMIDTHAWYTYLPSNYSKYSEAREELILKEQNLSKLGIRQSIIE